MMSGSGLSSEVGNDGQLNGVMSRRRLLRLALGVGVAAVVAGTVGSHDASAAGSYYRTTSAVNLRNAANTKAAILLVIPKGALAYDLGTSKNGFIKVEYDGVAGWAHGKYLTSTTAVNAPVIIGISNTTRSVNFRSGPSMSHEIIAVLPKYTQVDLSDTVQTGFTFVEVDGVSGWIYTEYLAGLGVQPTFLTTTSALNLRSQPNTGATVILVIPQGASVEAGDQKSNGYRMVTYKNDTGWAYEAYLA